MVLNFDNEKTLAFILDTEWYVPLADRTTSLSSLKVNPTRPEHRFIGGVFYCFHPLNKNEKVEKKEIFVNSLNENDEKNALAEVYTFFNEHWEQLAGKRDSVPDLITIGTGISRLDLPGLFARSVLLGIDDVPKLYDTYLKTKVVDLSEVAIPYFNKNRPNLLYPVPTNSIMSMFNIEGDLKTTGKSVWEMVDKNDFDGVKNRVRGEVETLYKIYFRIVKEIFH